MKKSPRVILLVFVLLAVATSALAQSSWRCAGCGNIITGDFYEIDGQYYHRDHFVCDHCLRPITEEFFTHQGRHYHTLCYQQQVATVCTLCNRIIEDEYRKDYWGNTYHASHYAEKPECDFCGRLIFGAYAAGKTRFPDGRELCGVCASSAVTNVHTADSLLVRVMELLQQNGVHVARKNMTVLLLDNQKIQQPFDTGPEQRVYGFTDYAAGMAPHGRLEYTGGNLCLLYGLPAVKMMDVIAHELMHVWQGGHTTLQGDDMLWEGSAGYAEYVVMKQVGSAEAEFIIHNLTENPDPVYGDGFRRVKRYADSHGVDALLKLLAADHPVIPADE